ncbi:MAG: FecR domain-containing protein, partial [Cyclobacteriaceae bacterium]
NFRKWVLKPGVSDNLYWERVFEKFPYKSVEATEAREIVLNLTAKKFDLSDHDLKQLWESIDKDLTKDQYGEEEKVIPLHSVGILKGSMKSTTHKYQQNYLLVKVAVIALLVVLIGSLAPSFFTKTIPKEAAPLVYEEKTSDAGVKIQLTLKDGTKVLLNSGTTVRYFKNFSEDKREIFLNGEAFFEIAQDSLRPFIVHSGDSRVIALGTSFIVNAYNTEKIDIALLEGKVAVETLKSPTPQLLYPGEALSMDIIGGAFEKRVFNKEKILSWTNKTILLDQTPLGETVRILENWYGVKIIVQNKPQKEIFLSGKFRDETLKNVLKGLSYASNFKFTINKDQVEIIF